MSFDNLNHFPGSLAASPPTPPTGLLKRGMRGSKRVQTVTPSGRLRTPSTSASARRRRGSDRDLASLCHQLENMVESVADLLPMSGIDRASNLENGCRLVTLYLCHVALGISQVRIARIFGLSRTLVHRTCYTIENRRDDRQLDDALEIIARLAVGHMCRKEVRDGA